MPKNRERPNFNPEGSGEEEESSDEKDESGPDEGMSAAEATEMAMERGSGKEGAEFQETLERLEEAEEDLLEKSDKAMKLKGVVSERDADGIEEYLEEKKDKLSIEEIDYLKSAAKHAEAKAEL